MMRFMALLRHWGQLVDDATLGGPLHNEAQFCRLVTGSSLEGQLCMPWSGSGCLPDQQKPMQMVLSTARHAEQLSGRMVQQMPQHGLEPRVGTVVGCSELSPNPLQVERAVKDGMDVRGLLYWTLVDK